MKHFFDTSALLTTNIDTLDEYPFFISTVTLNELESIKSSGHKDEEVKYQARCVDRWLAEHEGKYEVISPDVDGDFSNDELIMESACRVKFDGFDIVVHTNDMCFYFIAKHKYSLNCVYDALQDKHEDIYKGYKVITPTDEELAVVYDTANHENVFGCDVNEYVMLQNADSTTQDVLCWTGESYRSLNTRGFSSKSMGNVKPLDEVQRMAFDTIANNDISVLFGRAGSGKTTIPLAFIMQSLEKNKYDKCYIVHSYDTLKNQKTLGYIKGDLLAKELYSGSIGGILSSKLGDMVEVERLIASNTIEIVPTANLRGVEFSNSIVYCSEAQNLDKLTLKTLIQRVKDNSKLILDGDILEQCDTNRGTGLFRMIDIFKGDKHFGCVKLKNNYRNPIGELADKM